MQVRIEMQGASARISVNAESAAVGEVLSNGLEQLRRDKGHRVQVPMLKCEVNSMVMMARVQNETRMQRTENLASVRSKRRKNAALKRR